MTPVAQGGEYIYYGIYMSTNIQEGDEYWLLANLSYTHIITYV